MHVHMHLLHIVRICIITETYLGVYKKFSMRLFSFLLFYFCTVWLHSHVRATHDLINYVFIMHNSMQLAYLAIIYG